jgi:hypothetical protein
MTTPAKTFRCFKPITARYSALAAVPRPFPTKGQFVQDTKTPPQWSDNTATSNRKMSTGHNRFQPVNLSTTLPAIFRSSPVLIMPPRRDIPIAARASFAFGPVKSFRQQTRNFSDAEKEPQKSDNKGDSSAEALNAELRCVEIMASIVMTLFGLYLGFSAASRLRRYLKRRSAKREIAKLRRRETELQGRLERFKSLTDLEGGKIPARFEKSNQESGIECLHSNGRRRVQRFPQALKPIWNGSEQNKSA